MTGGAFLVRRLAATVAVLIGISFLIFSLLSLAPGSAVGALLGGRPSTPQLVQAIEAEYHLNDPFMVQYWHWVSGVVQGDLGRSVASSAPVTTVISDRLPVTLELAGLALFMSLLVGIPAGFLAGIRSGSGVDRSISGLAVVGLGAPVFAVAIMLSYLFGVELGWFPVFGAGSGAASRLEHLALPAIALALGLVALIVRQTRASVIDVMDQDYITFAHARGLSTSRTAIHYVLRNSSLPIVTTAGLLAVYAISGTVLVENVFSIQGLGSALTSAIAAKDIPVAQGIALVIAVGVVLIAIIVDLAILALDPRTRHRGAS